MMIGSLLYPSLHCRVNWSFFSVFGETQNDLSNCHIERTGTQDICVSSQHTLPIHIILSHTFMSPSYGSIFPEKVTIFE